MLRMRSYLVLSQGGTIRTQILKISMLFSYTKNDIISAPIAQCLPGTGFVTKSIIFHLSVIQDMNVFMLNYSFFFSFSAIDNYCILIL